MTTLAHVAYPTLAYLGLNNLTGNFATNQELYILMAGAVVPDTDFFYQLARGKGFDHTYQHHKWISHWPITYLPLLLLAFFTTNTTVSLITYGIFSHLFLDLFYVADGVMIFYPMSKKFYGFIPLDTKGHHGEEWIRKYKTRFIYKLDIVATILLFMILILRKVQ